MPAPYLRSLSGSLLGVYLALTNASPGAAQSDEIDEIQFQACLFLVTMGFAITQAHFQVTANPEILFEDDPFGDETLAGVVAEHLDLKLALTDPSAAIMQAVERDSGMPQEAFSAITNYVVSGNFEQALYAAYIEPGLSGCFASQTAMGTPICFDKLAGLLEREHPECYSLIDSQRGGWAAMREDFTGERN